MVGGEEGSAQEGRTFCHKRNVLFLLYAIAWEICLLSSWVQSGEKTVAHFQPPFHSLPPVCVFLCCRTMRKRAKTAIRITLLSQLFFIFEHQFPPPTWPNLDARKKSPVCRRRTCLVKSHNMHQWLPWLLTTHIPQIDGLCLFPYFNLSAITPFYIGFTRQFEVYIPRQRDVHLAYRILAPYSLSCKNPFPFFCYSPLLSAALSGELRNTFSFPIFPQTRD